MSVSNLSIKRYWS